MYDAVVYLGYNDWISNVTAAVFEGRKTDKIGVRWSTAVRFRLHEFWPFHQVLSFVLPTHRNDSACRLVYIGMHEQAQSKIAPHFRIL